MTAVDVKPGEGTMAERADIHELYEESVQNVGDEVNTVQGLFKQLKGREAFSLREDFCGTASFSCAWAKKSERHTAVGIDIDSDVLEWGRNNRISKLTEVQRARVRLVNSDVMTADVEPVDLISAFNFSYWIFNTREQMKAYFTRVREGLKDDGVFFMDVFGGSEAFEETKEKTKHDGFTYVWHQANYEPVTGRMVCHIHFKFPDKSKIKKAFTYEWRLWTLPELQEILIEAGFANARVFWEHEDDEGEGTGEFYEEAKGEADPAWIAYIVAEK